MVLRLALCLIALFGVALTEQPPEESTKMSCTCPRLFKPVCGTDAHTYNSECKLKCAQEKNAGLRMAYQGICCPEPFCPGHWDPLCDDHGHTHENECMFRYAFCVMRKTDNLVLKIAAKSECKPGSCDADCPKLTDPVCDTSGHTHENMCWFDNANCLLRQAGQHSLLIAYKGECVKTTPSPTIAAQFFTTLVPTTSEPPVVAISREPISGGHVDIHAPIVLPEPTGSPSPPEQAIGSPEPEPGSNASSSEQSSKQELPIGASLPEPVTNVQEPQESVIPPNSLSTIAVPEPEPEPTGSSVEPEASSSSEPPFVIESSSLEPETSSATSFPEPESTTLIKSPVPEPTAAVSAGSSEPEQTPPVGLPRAALAASSHKQEAKPEPEPKSSSEEPVLDQSNLQSNSHKQEAKPEPEPKSSSEEPVLDQSNLQPNKTGQLDIVLSPHDTAQPQESQSASITAEPSSDLFDVISISSPQPQPEPEPAASLATEHNVTTAQWKAKATDTVIHSINDTFDPTLHPFDSEPHMEGSEHVTSADCTLSVCPSLEEPICDNTGRTHINKCEFELMVCMDRRHGVVETKWIAHEGSCVVQPEVQAQEGEQIDGPVIEANIDARLPSLAVEQTSHSRPVICSAAACTKESNPVCDTNGKTHRNRCMFEFYSCKLAIKMGEAPYLALAHDGECEIDTTKHDELIFNGCPLCHPEEQVNGVPVCDNANQTYPSLCIFNAHNCRQKRQNGGGAQRVLVHFGECRSTSPIFSLEQEQCPQSCNSEYKPLCDNRGMTHPNLCSFQSVNCLLRKQGEEAPYVINLAECAQTADIHQSQPIVEQQATTPHPPRAFPPVKFDRNVSQVAFPRRQLTTTQFECPEPRCENERRPVCDSDGNAHRNPCLFAWARCLAAQQGKDLTIAREGPCSGNCTEKSCNNTFEPVCGSDLITYPNVCFFRQAQCEKKELELLFNDECEQCLRESCPQLEADADDALFVCDTNGDTKSRCEFKMVQCIYERKSGQNISELHSGRCCADVDMCPVTPNPVCDSRGVTSRNRCVFEVERCKVEKIQGGTLTLVKELPCEVNATSTLTTDSPVKLPSSSTASSSDLSSSVLGVEKIPGSSAHPVVAVPIASSLDCQAACTDDYKPVCGTDGKTYANQCKMNSAKCKNHFPLELAYDGECCDMHCPKQWSPICDTNGVTHENICEFGKMRCTDQRTTKQDIKIASYGICQQSSCDRPCTAVYEPVCGTNARTYANRCELEKASCVTDAKVKFGSMLKEDYQGECCEDENCPYSFAPVCDSQGKTHSNMCVFKRESCFAKKRSNISLTVQYEGPCCNQPCTDDAAPVCDGNTTHKNLCLFRISQCEAQKRGEDRSILYQGQCCAPLDATCAGTVQVCDSDGETHDNSCAFEHKRCLTMKQQRRNISIVHEGECCAQQVCKEEYKPVCDSLGVTHPNMCEFDSRKCNYDKTHKNSTMQFAYKGECCDQTCETDWQPVCDQHGALYKNKCDFAVRSCEADRRTGSILLQTPCPARQARRSLRRHLNHS